MYADAYPCAIPPERLDRLARLSIACWAHCDAQQARGCALRAASDGFCPCLAFAAGGMGDEREHAILDAVADEMKRRADHELDTGHLKIVTSALRSAIPEALGWLLRPGGAPRGATPD